MYKIRERSAVLCIAIFMVLGMWGMLSAHCLAIETNNDETQPQTIRIGSFEDTFDYVDQNGVRRGYGYELLQALAGSLKADPSFRYIHPFTPRPS